MTDVLADLRDAGAVRRRARSAEHSAMVTIRLALVAGHKRGLSITEMAAAAGITRQTAYNLHARGVPATPTTHET